MTGPVGNIGDNMKAARIAAGLSLSEMARRAGLTKSNLHDIERGQVMPGIDKVLKVGYALGLTVSDLIGETHPWQRACRMCGHIEK